MTEEIHFDNLPRYEQLKWMAKAILLERQQEYGDAREMIDDIFSEELPLQTTTYVRDGELHVVK